MRAKNTCLSFQVTIELCDSTSPFQKWTRNRVKKRKNGPVMRGYQIKHYKHDLCLDTSDISGEKGLSAFRCDPGVLTQRFAWSYSPNTTR